MNDAEWESFWTRQVRLDDGSRESECSSPLSDATEVPADFGEVVEPKPAVPRATAWAAQQGPVGGYAYESLLAAARSFANAFSHFSASCSQALMYHPIWHIASAA